MKRLLVLEDGTVFEGEAFGADIQSAVKNWWVSQAK